MTERVGGGVKKIPKLCDVIYGCPARCHLFKLHWSSLIVLFIVGKMILTFCFFMNIKGTLPLLNDVTQLKGRGKHFCDSIVEGQSKTGSLV